jgi:hypothetical protein
VDEELDAVRCVRTSTFIVVAFTFLADTGPVFGTRNV